MDQFRYITHSREILFGTDIIQKLGEAVEPFGWQRFMLCTGQALEKAGHVLPVKAALGKRLVVVFDRVLPHVQDIQTDQLLKIAREGKVDAIIGLGGGSPIGMAKAIAHGLEASHSGSPNPASPMEPSQFGVIAIPTTYAGSEMTAVYGTTRSRENPPRKVTVSDPRIAPRLILYDPKLTLDLNPEMTASTGMNALAHCIEALYSITRNPLSTAAAVSGIRSIARSLLRCTQHGEDLEARTDMLLGAHLAGLSLSGISMGLHHGLCHVLGGTAGVPHGIANSIILPHAVRFNADATADLLLPAVDALGIPPNGRGAVAAVETAAGEIFQWTGKMNLPQHLRQVGIKETDLPGLAELAFQNRTVQNNPKPITDAIQIERLLQEAW